MRSAPLRKLMNAYCSSFRLQSSQMRFVATGGKRIGAEDTVELPGLHDMDLIEVTIDKG